MSRRARRRMRRLSHWLFVAAAVVSVPGGWMFGMWWRGRVDLEDKVIRLAALAIVLLVLSIVTHPALWSRSSGRG